MTPVVYGILFFTLGAAIIFASWVTARHLSASRQAKAAIATNKDFQSLADEYRRLSDMAITAQEHTDLRLTDISVRIDQLRAQSEQCSPETTTATYTGFRSLPSATSSRTGRCCARTRRRGQRWRRPLRCLRRARLW